MAKTTEPNPTDPAFPPPPPPAPVPPPGSMAPDQRQRRVVRLVARLARGMASTAPQRGDALGPLWAELAADCEAFCREAGIDDGLPAPAPAPPNPAAVIPMAGGPTAGDAILGELVNALARLEARLPR